MSLSVKFILLLGVLLGSLNGFTQDAGQFELKGKVIDQTSGDGLPFATLILRNAQKGTSTNSDGEFSFLIKPSEQQDSIAISYIGYESVIIAISDVKILNEIPVTPAANLLSEVIVRPLSPEEYLKIVKQKVAANYSEIPFSNMAYYREEVRENGAFIMHSEGVFKTYYDAYQVDAKRQHQLLLYRKSKDIRELQFMKEKALKEQEKHLEKHPEDTVKYNGEDPEDLLMTNLGGPENILQIDVLSDALSFLDSNQFMNFRYVYGPPNSFNGKELITIDFKSKGKVDNARRSGRIYIDKKSDAITAIKIKGELVVPILIRPVLLVMGISLKNMHFDVNLQYTEINELWFPQQIQWNVGIDVLKRKTFKPNEAAHFDIEQFYVVNSRELETPSNISPSKRYSSKLKMKDQIHNDLGLTWPEINVIH